MPKRYTHPRTNRVKHDTHNNSMDTNSHIQCGPTRCNRQASILQNTQTVWSPIHTTNSLWRRRQRHHQKTMLSILRTNIRTQQNEIWNPYSVHQITGTTTGSNTMTTKTKQTPSVWLLIFILAFILITMSSINGCSTEPTFGKSDYKPKRPLCTQGTTLHCPSGVQIMIGGCRPTPATESLLCDCANPINKLHKECRWPSTPDGYYSGQQFY